MENQSLSALQEKIKTNDEAIAMFSEEVEVFKENDYLDVSIILLAFIVLVVDFGAVILVPTAIPSHVSLLFFFSALGTLAFSYIKLIKEHSDLVRLKFFKELVKGLPLSVILINPRNDSVVYANHKAHESLRYSPNTITLKYLLIGSLGIEFDNGTTSWLERLRNDGLHYKRGSYQMQRLDGTTFHAYSRSCYLSYKGSDYILFIFQNEDYRRKQERAIQQENTALQSYNNELTSRMQKVAHDIRAELATAAGVVDYFVHDETDKEKKEF
ncbi:MAG: hypothetical protein NT091_04020, partial [Candidatus Falkowbacteria bacterium]|nr:hypothetical protein [Candidatus Falkowbacteria bacterium]